MHIEEIYNILKSLSLKDFYPQGNVADDMFISKVMESNV